MLEQFIKIYVTGVLVGIPSSTWWSLYKSNFCLIIIRKPKIQQQPQMHLNIQVGLSAISYSALLKLNKADVTPLFTLEISWKIQIWFYYCWLLLTVEFCLKERRIQLEITVMNGSK